MSAVEEFPEAGAAAAEDPAAPYRPSPASEPLPEAPPPPAPEPSPEPGPPPTPPTEVGASTGPAHHGSGTQVNTFYSPLVADSAFLLDPSGRLKRRSPRLITDDQATALSRQFVAGPGYQEAKRLLGSPGRTAILYADAGCGRRSSALMLLDAMGDGHGRLRELPEGDPGDPDAPPVLDGRDLQPGDRVLVDLTGDDRGLLGEVRAGLESYRHAVRECEAYLVLVIPPEEKNALGQEFARFLVGLGRPDGARVLQRHLQARGIDYSEQEARDGGVLDWAASAGMGEIAELARLAEEVGRRNPGAPLRGRLGTALEALADRGEEAGGRIAGLPDTWRRSVLLAAAMLEGFRAEAVADAARALFALLDAPEPEQPRLERVGFRTLLRELEVAVGEDHTVAFQRFGLAEAVCDRFWDEYPDLVGEFRTWIDGLIAAPSTSGSDRDALARRFVRQCLRTHRTEELFGRVWEWGRRAETAPQAAYALTEAHDRGGAIARRTRRRIYRWAGDRALPAPLAQVLIAVCTGTIADTWPEEAVVRLQHLARHDDPEVRRAAADGLLALAADPARLGHLTHRVRWVLENRGRPRPRDLAVAALLTDPGRLHGPGSERHPLRDPESREDAAAIIGLLIRAGEAAGSEPLDPAADPAAAAERWIDACASEWSPPGLPELLARGAHRAGSAGRLYGLARRRLLTASGDGAEAQRGAAAELIRLLDEVQGLLPAGAPAAGTRTEG
ncbi:hypothetical protein [Nocardiopsis composta]|uniref:Uncharacterized protein n=1 Tax=Nocardiopsis composta TaxID=157465 RepID=A0A7W8VCR7_9ACTN|nr:hypothetical protein [Nocardiopsis composta]MBB5431228.1 hypothetical protein [Nocardiopsis composta]